MKFRCDDFDFTYLLNVDEPGYLNRVLDGIGTEEIMRPRIESLYAMLSQFICNIPVMRAICSIEMIAMATGCNYPNLGIQPGN